MQSTICLDHISFAVDDALAVGTNKATQPLMIALLLLNSYHPNHTFVIGGDLHSQFFGRTAWRTQIRRIPSSF